MEMNFIITKLPKLSKSQGHNGRKILHRCNDPRRPIVGQNNNPSFKFVPQ